MFDARYIPGLARNNPNVDCGEILSDFLKHNPTDLTLTFPAGQYFVGSTIYAEKLSRVKLIGEPGAEFIKLPMKQEYLLYVKNSQDIDITGLGFQGLTTATDAYKFGEQGVLISGCKRVGFRENQLFNFGDALLRVTHGSEFIWITDNYAENCFQLTTTPNGDIKDGKGLPSANHLLIAGNKFKHLKGSLKLATRTPASNAIIQNNEIQNAPNIVTSSGIEVCSFNNLIADGNTISGSASWGINVYTNNSQGLKKFDWGKQIYTRNKIKDVARGIRISNPAYSDGEFSDTTGICVDENELENLVASTGVSGITFVNGPFTGSSCRNNKLKNVISNQPFIFPDGVAQEGNEVA